MYLSWQRKHYLCWCVNLIKSEKNYSKYIIKHGNIINLLQNKPKIIIPDKNKRHCNFVARKSWNKFILVGGGGGITLKETE